MANEQAKKQNIVFGNNGIGHWIIDIEEGAVPNLYVDEVAFGFIDCPEIEGMTNAELFGFWQSLILQEDYNSVTLAISQASRGSIPEVQFRWNHPQLGIKHFRAGGSCNFDVADSIRIEGYIQCLQDVESIKTRDTIQVEELVHMRPFSELFMTSYVSAYYINLVDCTQIKYRTNEYIGGRYGRYTNYVEGLTAYINDNAHPDDRPLMLQAIQPQYIRMRLMEKKEYSVVMRDMAFGVPHYFRFQVLRGLDENHAAICFTDIDEEIQRQQEIEDSGNVIKSLAMDYDVVFSANFETLESRTYYRSEGFSRMVGAIPHTGEREQSAHEQPIQEPDYRTRINLLGNFAVHPDDREMFFANVSEDKLMRDMEEGKTIVIEFRVVRAGEIRHMQGRVIPNRYGGKNEAVFGVRDIEEEYQARMRAQAQELEKQRVLEALAGDFACVNYIEIGDSEEEDKIVNYRLSTVLAEALPGWDSECDFRKKLDMLETLVHPDDKEIYRKQVSREYLMHSLKDGIAEYCVCRLVIGEQAYYYQLKFIGEIQDGKIVSAVVGIRDMDAAIRKQMNQEAAIQLQTRSYAMLHDMIRSGMWSVDYDTDGHVSHIDWSDEFCKMLGYTQEEFPGTTDALLTVLHPDDRRRVWDAIDATLDDKTDGKIFDESAQMFTKDRGYRWFRATGSVLRDEEGRGIRFFGIFIDINDEKELERMTQEHITALESQVMLQSQLAKEKDHIKMLHDIIHSAMWSMEIAAGGEVSDIFWSDDFRKMLGYSTEDEFPNYLKTIEDILYVEDKEHMITCFWQVVNDKSAETEYDDRFRMYTKQGEVRWFHAMGRVIRNTENGEGSFYGTLIDITAEHDNEQMQMVISGLTEDFACVCLVDISTDDDYVYHFDDNYRKLLPDWDSASDFGERLNMICERTVYYADRKMFLDGTKKAVVLNELAQKQSYVLTYRMCHGRTVEYWQVKFIYAEGYDNQLVAGFRNVDAEIRMERERQEELIEAQKHAEDANEAKSKFLFNMSHDIRTPMNAIMGFSAMAEKYASDPEKVVDCLGKIEVAGEHLLKLINDVLDMARIESGKVMLEEAESNIFENIDELVTILKEGAESSNLTMNVYTDEIRDAYVYCDVLHVNQILLNILSNAVKYTKPGGRIDFTVRQTDCEQPGYASYEFVVKDTGIGMTKEVQEHIFDSFVRAQSATVSGIQGTGLGMAIAKQLTDQMGGTISVESEPDVGTEVTLRLSFRLLEESKQNGTDGQNVDYSVSLSGKRILLVEDNELNREIAMDILMDEGLVVDEADDGTVAVEIMKKVGPDYYDAILMDIQMPIMDGYEATRTIRALTSADYSRIPIIAMTANAFEEDKMNALAAGMNEHLPKPIKVGQLMETLMRFVQ